MTVNVTDIIDLFMTLVDDYRLTALFQSSEDDFTKYMKSYVNFAIVEFTPFSKVSLTYNSTSLDFDVDLSLEVQTILAQLMVKYWLQKEVQDISQMSIHLQDKDFRTHSEANNLKEKSSHLDKVKETCSQLINDYSYRNNDWSTWFSQSFGV